MEGTGHLMVKPLTAGGQSCGRTTRSRSCRLPSTLSFSRSIATAPARLLLPLRLTCLNAFLVGCSFGFCESWI